eukprot:SAG31_NODE_29551_length_393_cov_1.054422_1_plen_33_part_10
MPPRMLVLLVETYHRKDSWKRMALVLLGLMVGI